MKLITDLIKDCNGISLTTIKKVLKEQSHCGEYWSSKPRYNPLMGTVTIQMSGNECYIYYMKYGWGYRWDWDDDGCSISNDFLFRIGGEKIIPVFRIHWSFPDSLYIIDPFSKEYIIVGKGSKNLPRLQSLIIRMLEVKKDKE